MQYTIETSQGFVQTISLLGGELNGVKSYTQDRTLARKFTPKQLKTMRVRSFFKYHSMQIIIAEVTDVS